MPKINYINANGSITTVNVAAGLTVMHGATTNMVDGILAECGGALTCATCHCYIDEKWACKTGIATNHIKHNSRLSCQITVDEQLDGLIVHFPESQVLQR